MSVVIPVDKSNLPSIAALTRVGIAAALAGGVALGSACNPATTHANRSDETGQFDSGEFSESNDRTPTERERPTEAVLAGFPARSVFEVSGMRCTSCAERIVAELEKLEGVRRVAFSEADARFAVEHDPRRIRAEGLEARIERLGYEAVLRPRERSSRPKTVQVAF